MATVTSGGPVELAGRYRLLGRLGRGGMAEVWEAHDEVLHRRVAVKLFRAAADDADARRAVGEMRTLARLTHPNLVTVHDAGSDGDQAFLVMELVVGSTLADRIGSAGGIGEVEAAAIGAQIAAGLAHVHREGVVHRDVKPGNVLLPRRDHVDTPVAKLADFGIAHQQGQERLTRTGTTIGTAQYLSPEQLTGRPVGAPADIYALGLVLLEMLGRAPAWTGTPIEIALARLTNPPVVPGDLGPVWTPLLTAMTAADPAARPSASDVREALAAQVTAPAVAVPTGTGVGSAVPTAVLTAAVPTPAKRTRRTRSIRWGVAAAVAAAAVGVGIALAAGSSEPGPPAGTATTAPATDTSPSPAATGSGTVAPSVTPTPSPTSTSAGSGPGTQTPPGQTKSKGKDKDKDKPGG